MRMNRSLSTIHENDETERLFIPPSASSFVTLIIKSVYDGYISICDCRKKERTDT